MVPTVQPRLSPQFEPAPQAGVLNAPRLFGTLSDETALDATIMEDDGHSPRQTTHPTANQQAKPPLVPSADESITPAQPWKLRTPTSDLHATTAAVTGAGPLREVLTPPQEKTRPSHFAPPLPIVRPISSTTEQQTRLEGTVNDANVVKVDAAPSRVTAQNNDEETADVQHDGHSRTSVQEQLTSRVVVRQKALPEEQTMLSSQVVTASTSDPSTQLSPLLPIIAQPQIRPLSMEPRDEGRRRSRKAAEPVAPTIQVTIGRIEIRAEQTKPSTAAKLRATQPVMSLDEYLRNCSNGGGR